MAQATTATEHQSIYALAKEHVLWPERMPFQRPKRPFHMLIETTVKTAILDEEIVASGAETAVSDAETVVTVSDAEMVVLDAEKAVSGVESVVSELKRSFWHQNDYFGCRKGTKTKGYENQCQCRAKIYVK